MGGVPSYKKTWECSCIAPSVHQGTHANGPTCAPIQHGLCNAAQERGQECKTQEVPNPRH
eukprot:936507-Pyramimonas_sp.AAC.1